MPRESRDRIPKHGEPGGTENDEPTPPRWHRTERQVFLRTVCPRDAHNHFHNQYFEVLTWPWRTVVLNRAALHKRRTFFPNCWVNKLLHTLPNMPRRGGWSSSQLRTAGPGRQRSVRFPWGPNLPAQAWELTQSHHQQLGHCSNHSQRRQTIKSSSDCHSFYREYFLLYRHHIHYNVMCEHLQAWSSIPSLRGTPSLPLAPV